MDIRKDRQISQIDGQIDKIRYDKKISNKIRQIREGERR
jgi:hypothetical protein